MRQLGRLDKINNYNNYEENASQSWRKYAAKPKHGVLVPFILLIKQLYLYLRMSTKYKFHDQESLYFITFAVVDWIDLFVRNEYRQNTFRQLAILPQK